MDAATGMYYYGARYYDPRISIFVSVDPLAEKFIGWTPYNYALNSPTNFIDPTGMGPETDFFDMFGKFVMTIKDGKNDIKVMTNRYELISPSKMKVSQGSNLALINIAKHYRNEMKISKKFLIGTTPSSDGSKSGENPAFTRNIDNVAYFNNLGGYSKDLDNLNSFKSILRHENKHQMDNLNPNHVENLVSHAEVYLYQMKQKEFSESPVNFQASIVASFWNYLYNIQEKKYGSLQIDDLLDSFNELNNDFYFDKAGRGTKVQELKLYHKGNEVSTPNFKKNEEN